MFRSLDVLAQALVQRREVDRAGLAAQGAVDLQRPHEAAVAARAGAGAEPEQRAERVAAERRQHGEDLEVGLGLAARVVVERQLAGQRAAQRARLVGGGEREDGEEELVVADHVGEVAAPHDAARRGDVRRPALRGRLLEVERAQLAQLERGRSSHVAAIRSTACGGRGRSAQRPSPGGSSVRGSGGEPA